MKNWKILIADDDFKFWKSVQSQLEENLPVHLHICPDFNSAQNLIREESWDFFFTETLFDSKNGIDLVKLARIELGLSPFIAVISSEKNFRTEINAYDWGADAYIQKPVNASIILARLRSLWRRNLAG